MLAVVLAASGANYLTSDAFFRTTHGGCERGVRPHVLVELESRPDALVRARLLGLLATPGLALEGSYLTRPRQGGFAYELYLDPSASYAKIYEARRETEYHLQFLPTEIDACARNRALRSLRAVPGQEGWLSPCPSDRSRITVVCQSSLTPMHLPRS